MNRAIKLVTYNIQYGRGRDSRYDLRRIAASLQDADIIALQEVERHWPRSDMADQPAELAALLPGYHWVYGAPYDMDASAVQPDGSLLSRRRQFGNMLLSRWPIVSTRLHHLPKFPTIDHYGLARGALEGVVATESGPLRVYSIHLGHLIEQERVAQARALREIVQRAPLEGGPWTGSEAGESDVWESETTAPPMPAEALLMGDFNCEPGAPAYDELVGPFDPENGRIAVADRFLDAWVVAGHDEASGATYPPNPAEGVTRPLRLDYVFVTAGLAPRIVACRIDDAAEGSDHQPVWLELAP